MVVWCTKMKCKFKNKCTLKHFPRTQIIFKNNLELFPYEYKNFKAFK